MSDNTLLTAFIVFTILLVAVAVIMRKMNIRDVFDDNSSSSVRPRLLQKISPKSPNFSSPALGKKSSAFNREKVYKVAKTISALGIILLIIPLPEVYRFIGLALALIGSMVAKATAPPKTKKPASR